MLATFLAAFQDPATTFLDQTACGNPLCFVDHDRERGQELLAMFGKKLDQIGR